MTVKELRDALKSYDDKAEVQVWLPGTYIKIGPIYFNRDKVLIEGNVITGGFN
jgi:hypothetical protein